MSDAEAKRYLVKVGAVLLVIVVAIVCFVLIMTDGSNDQSWRDDPAYQESSETAPYAPDETEPSVASDEPYGLPANADAASYVSALRQLDPILDAESDSKLLQLGALACSILDTGASTTETIQTMMIPNDAYEGQTTARVVIGADRYLCP